MIYDKGVWIYLDEVSTGEKSYYGAPAAYFRKEFTSENKVKRATLYASAIGVFKAYLNGKPIDDDYLSPGWTDYRKRIPYIEYDVTDKIETNNAIAIVAADGWAVGNIGYEVERQRFNDRVEVFASLVIEYSEGTRKFVETDTTWKATHGEILRSDLLMGEVVDARLCLGDFSTAEYNDGTWEQAKTKGGSSDLWKIYYLDKAIAPKTKVKHRLSAKFLHFDKKGRAIYDLGQNMAGVIEVRLCGKRGSKAVFRHGEMLYADGSLYTANLRLAEATDTYFLAGNGEEIFRPLFTFHGFRYVEIAIDGDVDIISVTGLAMYSDLTETASFSCNDEVVNRLYKNIVWGQRSNFLNIPTDCPQRDERLGWTGDSQVFCGTAMFNMDCRQFYKKHLTDIRDAQSGNGAVPGIAPIVPHHDHSVLQGRLGAAGWGDAITILPYEYYRMYGDVSVVKENLAAAKRFVGYCLACSDDYIRPERFNYGDWLELNETSDISLVSTAYFAYSVYLTAKLCEIAGDNDSSYYTLLFAKIRTAFRKCFMETSTGRLKSDTQTVYLLAYRFGLMDAEEIRPHLLRAIERNDGKLTTGFLGVKHLLPVLCELGETEIAYRLFTSKEYPSWCYPVVNGATTIWERWNSYTKERGFGDVSMNSFNHYAYGSVGEWMFRYCLGIQPSAAPGEGGFTRLLLRPYLDLSGKITHAEGYYDSVRGRVFTCWQRETDDIYTFAYSVPKDISVAFDFGDLKAEPTGNGIFTLRNDGNTILCSSRTIEKKGELQ